MSRPVITLLTDFGTRDAYVAAMRGVLLALAPESLPVDITHHVPPQDVLVGSLVAAQAWPYFPQGSVHVAVVDPGVGTARASLAVEAGGSWFVGPDNGLLSPAVPVGSRPQGDPTVAAVCPLPEGVRLWRIDHGRLSPGRPVSSTFQGRDVFAPAAARLARGEPADAFAAPADRLWCFPVPQARRSVRGVLSGVVLYIDHFGNAVTSIREEQLVAGLTVEALARDLGAPVRTFGDLRPGQPGALVGSAGFLEVVMRDGSAAATLGIGRGDVVVCRPLERR